MNLVDSLLRRAETSSDKTALVIDRQRLSYQDLLKMADHYAARLQGLGICAGDRVSLFMGNRPELAALYLACFRLGAVAVPTSCYIKGPEARYELNHCGSKLLITEPGLFPEVSDFEKTVPSLNGIYLVGADPMPPARLLDDVQPTVDLAGPADRKEDDPAVILYTSGSTGPSKGVTHTLGSLTQNTRNRCEALSHHFEDVYFISAFLCHGSALTSVFLPMLAVGGTVVLMRSYTPEGFLECLRRERPTVVGVSPSQIASVLNAPSAAREDFESIRYLHVGGDAAPLELFDEYRHKTGREMSIAMGMTECGGYLLTPPEGPFKPGSMGRPIPGTEIRLLDENRREVPTGQVGEVVVRTGALMAGYWDDPGNTAKVLKDGWLLTGDLARRDEDGFYFFVGRSKHIIVRDGSNVAPVEVEDVLDDHPKVKASGVAGIPDPEHGQMVVALIVPVSQDDPPTPRELEDFARRRLADRRIPQKWLFVDHIPLTPMTKIDRKALAQMALKG